MADTTSGKSVDVSVAAPRLRPVPAVDVAPYPSFRDAARRALAILHGEIGLDVWLVSRFDDDRQVVLVAHPDARFPGLGAGAFLPWAATLCARMASGRGPRVAADTATVPAYAELRSLPGPASLVRSYIGVPLADPAGNVFGSVCGYGLDSTPQLGRHLPLVELLARMLSTVYLAEERGRASVAVAAPRAGTERGPDQPSVRDADSGLLDAAGWAAALQREQVRLDRCRGSASVLALQVRTEPEPTDEDFPERTAESPAARIGGILRRCARGEDVLARTGADEFAILVGDSGAHNALHVLARVRDELHSAGLSVSVGVADSSAGGVTTAWQQARSAMAAMAAASDAGPARYRADSAPAE